MRVLKWEVPVDEEFHLVGSGQVVHVACQADPGTVAVWTCESEEEGRLRVSRAVRAYPTGRPVPPLLEHLGTALAADGALVWHLFGEPCR